MNPPRRRPHWLTIVGVIATIVIATMMGLMLSGSSGHHTQYTGTPDPSPNSITPSPMRGGPITLEVIKQQFGPFVEIDGLTTNPNLPVLLLQAKHRPQLSTTWTIAFDTTVWKPDTQLDAQLQQKVLHADGSRVALQLDKDHKFTVATTEPFILDTQPGTAYLFDQAGQTWSVSVQRVLQSPDMRRGFTGSLTS